jgi:uncharacterized RmlC-like cupin family protein
MTNFPSFSERRQIEAPRRRQKNMSEKSATLDQTTACMVLRAGDPFIGKQGLSYAAAISAETVGSSAIHMQLVTIPPGGRGKAHKHEGHETAIYVLQGEAGTYYGERLEHHVLSGAGDFIYIGADVPHLPYNMSQTEPCVAVVSRTDPNEQESVVLLPELDALHK